MLIRRGCLLNPAVPNMTNEEQTWQELEKLENAYRQKFPQAQDFDRFSSSPGNLIELLRQANGREIILTYREGVVDGGEYSFKESETKPITLQELLYSRGLPIDSKTKLVRHRDTGGTVEVNGVKLALHDLYHKYPQRFMEYQQEQRNPIFHNCDYVVSCLGEDGSRARFVGVYKIDFQEVERDPEDVYQYTFSKVAGFETLEERVIIDWGKAALSWHQWFRPIAQKLVLEIQPKLFGKPFTDYLDFTLSFSELQKLVATQSPRDEWCRLLSAVAGIYLILDTSNGQQYVGSAYGQGGVWQRWNEYVATKGHGNNVLLKKLLNSNSDYGQLFQFTLLMTLPKSLTKEEVFKHEMRFKHKLGSRAFGLNLN